MDKRQITERGQKVIDACAISGVNNLYAVAKRMEVPINEVIVSKTTALRVSLLLDDDPEGKQEVLDLYNEIHAENMQRHREHFAA